MSLRWRILLVSVVLAVVPLATAILLLGRGVEDQFTEQDTARVEARVQLLLDDLDRRDARLAASLDALAETIAADNRFRLAALEQRDDLRSYLHDYAPRQLALMDLDLLFIQDDRDTVVSSGHFRDAHGEPLPRLAHLVGQARGGRALASARSPAGIFLAQVRARSFRLGDHTWQLVAGLRLDPGDLIDRARDPDLTVALAWPGAPAGTVAPEERAVMAREMDLRRAGHIVRTVNLPLVHEGRLTDAWLLVSHDRVSLHRFVDGVESRLRIILVVAALFSVGLATLLANQVSRPLRRLAHGTRELDLEKLDTRFPAGGRDEVGQLSRLFNELLERLQQGVGRLRRAEHRATLGEVARQVNHDIRNGITPLRNVLQHLGQVADQEPERLAGVFGERRDNLAEGLSYLEDLAGHYARLSPADERRPCRLDELCAAVVAQFPPSAPGAPRPEARVEPDLPPVLADPVSLRRILDNLVRNALESLPEGRGRVTVTARRARDEALEEDRILLEVADDGVGIAPEDRDRIFDDFFTTRPDGTGLGLSNVRRLVGDLGGRIGVTSEPGRGTTVTVSLPLPDTGEECP
ncbi:MAG: HAMP domain-containing histidine kinase [bacterium]|nr:HAMP domain-containing histidine kinase [bacterium]